VGARNVIGTMTEARPDVPRLAVADLFSGAGGLSDGFSAAGFELAFALDKDDDSCVTYERNFRCAPEHASITDFEPSDLAGKLQDVDVILGGPSCQTFSTQGRRFKWADPDDERTKLWTHMLALVDEVRPRAFLLENVPGLSHKGLAYEKDGRAGRGQLAEPEAIVVGHRTEIPRHPEPCKHPTKHPACHSKG